MKTEIEIKITNKYTYARTDTDIKEVFDLAFRSIDELEKMIEAIPRSFVLQTYRYLKSQHDNMKTNTRTQFNIHTVLTVTQDGKKQIFEEWANIKNEFNNGQIYWDGVLFNNRIILWISTEIINTLIQVLKVGVNQEHISETSPWAFLKVNSIMKNSKEAEQ